MPPAYLQSDYCSEKMSKYCVKIAGDLDETKGKTASKIPQ
jgi:hypothetical protein